MKTSSRFGAALLLVSAVVAFSGCYTQVGGVLDDRYEPDPYVQDQNQQEEEYDSTYVESEGGYGTNWEYRRPNTYFDYYYPSFTFGFGYYSPWYMHPWNSWRYGYYDPFYSDPWGWGVYGGGYAPGWWYPHNSGYVSGRMRPNISRTFGNTRAFGTSRGTVSTTGSGNTRPGDETLIQGYRTSGRPAGNAGKSGVTTGRQGNSSRSTEGRSSAPARRVAPGSRRSGESRPSSTPPPRNDGGNGGRESSGGGRSYSPPPSSGSSGSAPARSSGGESGGSRSSGNRR